MKEFRGCQYNHFSLSSISLNCFHIILDKENVFIVDIKEKIYCLHCQGGQTELLKFFLTLSFVIQHVFLYSTNTFKIIMCQIQAVSYNCHRYKQSKKFNLGDLAHRYMVMFILHSEYSHTPNITNILDSSCISCFLFFF